MHHGMLKNACVDIDGVLNVDPSFETDDDGSTYVNFIENAIPLFLPTAPIDTLISCRLEKYRPQTEQWLKKHGVRYNHLVLVDLPTKHARLKWNRHGEYKTEYYKSHKDLYLFIESSQKQARIIADVSQKPVICIETNSLVIPNPPKVSFLKRVKRYMRRKYPKIYNIAQRIVRR